MARRYRILIERCINYKDGNNSDGIIIGREDKQFIYSQLPKNIVEHLIRQALYEMLFKDIRLKIVIL
jgi:hypothetical protein